MVAYHIHPTNKMLQSSHWTPTPNRGSWHQWFQRTSQIKYKATKAIVGRFPNGTETLMHLLSNAVPALDWNGYCTVLAETRILWETRADALTQGTIYIMNSKNEIAKKDLRLAYSQGNHTSYPTNIETTTWYITTQYPNIKSYNQRKKQTKESGWSKIWR